MSFGEVSIELPSRVVEQGPGLAIDLGGPMVKVLYRSKEDYDNGKQRSGQGEQKYGQLRLLTCNHDDISQMLDHMASHSYVILNSSSQTTIPVCGEVDSALKTQLEKTLGVRTTGVSKFQSIVNSLLHFNEHMPVDKCFLPTPSEAITESKSIIDLYTTLKENSSKMYEAQVDYDINEDNVETLTTDIFPCLLVSMESWAHLLKVTKEGQFQKVAELNAGRTFVGTASALTGVTEFDELMAMATRGDCGTKSSTDVYAFELKGDGEEDAYQTFPDDFLTFPFGKCVTNSRESIEKDDLVFSALNLSLMDLAQFVHLTAVVNKVDKVIFCGSFVSHPLVHKLLAKYMRVRCLLGKAEEPPMDYMVLRHSAHLSAIGAYVNQFVTKETTQQLQ